MSIPFLDILVPTVNNSISTSLHTTPTDSPQLLEFMASTTKVLQGWVKLARLEFWGNITPSQNLRGEGKRKWKRREKQKKKGKRQTRDNN